MATVNPAKVINRAPNGSAASAVIKAVKTVTKRWTKQGKAEERDRRLQIGQIKMETG